MTTSNSIINHQYQLWLSIHFYYMNYGPLSIFLKINNSWYRFEKNDHHKSILWVSVCIMWKNKKKLWWEKLKTKWTKSLQAIIAKEDIINAVFMYTTGTGTLDPLCTIPTVTDIMENTLTILVKCWTVGVVWWWGWLMNWHGAVVLSMMWKQQENQACARLTDEEGSPVRPHPELIESADPFLQPFLQPSWQHPFWIVSTACTLHRVVFLVV